MPILLLLLALIGPVAKVDLDLDGSADKIYVEARPEPVVAVGDLGRPPTFQLEVIVKLDGKLQKAGRVRNVTGFRFIREWTVLNEQGEPTKRIAFFTTAGPMGARYWALIGQPLTIVEVPEELFGTSAIKIGS